MKSNYYYPEPSEELSQKEIGLLKQALKECMDEEMEEVTELTGKAPAKPSKRFERRLRRTIWYYNSGPKRALSRIGKLCAAVMLLFCVSYGASENVRAFVSNFVINRHDTYDNVGLHEEIINEDTEPEYHEFILGYVPEGYELVDSDISEISGFLLYRNSDNKQFEVTYDLNTQNSIGNLDNEHTIWKEITLRNGVSAYCGEPSDSVLSIYQLYWLQDGYIFSIMGDLNRAEMEKIAVQIEWH